MKLEKFEFVKSYQIGFVNNEETGILFYSGAELDVNGFQIIIERDFYSSLQESFEGINNIISTIYDMITTDNNNSNKSTSMRKITFLSSSLHCIGIGSRYDKITNQEFIYIAKIDGYDEKEDEKYVFEWGAKIEKKKFLELISL